MHDYIRYREHLAQIARTEPGGIPAEKHRLLGGSVTVQLLRINSNLRQFTVQPDSDSDGLLVAQPVVFLQANMSAMGD